MARIATATLAAIVLLALAPGASAYINPKFTPADLVRESRLVVVGTLRPAADKAPWRLTIADQIKGKDPGAITIALAPTDVELAQSVAKLLAANGADPVLLFASGAGASAQGFLHVSGDWLAIKPAGSGQWQITAVDQKMTGVFAGGTDMLIRLSRALAADPRATVPVAVGVSWMADRIPLGRVTGAVAGMQSIELDRRRLLFVGAAGGDKLFAAKDNDESFDDMTASAELDTRSRQFTFAPLAGGAGPCLVSWDGAAIRAGTFRNGKFVPLGEPFDFRGPCRQLFACTLPDRTPAVLVSSDEVPLLLWLDPAGNWASLPLESGGALRDAGEVTCPCIVADLDGDGYSDVLQPRSKSGALWRGKAGGFESPVPSPVRCEKGPGRFCLGDFDGDGALDIFLTSPTKNELWENDGKAGFRPVIAAAGSLAYRCAPGASFSCPADLNHDGRTDLCVFYPQGDFGYHFNRGFRCFGEEGELRLAPPKGTAVGTGQVAAATADFNGDGSLDLAVTFADGQVACYYSDSFDKPMLRLGLKPGLPRPITASVWQGDKTAACLGTFSLGDQPIAVPLRDDSEVTVLYALPGKPGLSVKVPATRPATAEQPVLLLGP